MYNHHHGKSKHKSSKEESKRESTQEKYIYEKKINKKKKFPALLEKKHYIGNLFRKSYTTHQTNHRHTPQYRNRRKKTSLY